MKFISQRITIINVRKPAERNINQELQWLGSSLGLFNMRDKDKSCFRVFIELIKSAKDKKSLTSDEIADKLALSRGTVIHHMNKLMDAGIVMHEANTYILRVNNLSELIEELEKDINRTLNDLREVARSIDSRLNRF
jgi:predicted transcriptional regulator